MNLPVYVVEMSSVERTVLIAALKSYDPDGGFDGLLTRLETAKPADPADDGPEVAPLRTLFPRC